MNKKFLLVGLISLFLLNGCQTSEANSPFSPTNTPRLKTATSTNTTTPTVTSTLPAAAGDITPSPSPSARPGKIITLMAVGDIMLGRTMGDLIMEEGPEAPFLNTGETLSTADITVGNLECPISTRGLGEDKKYTFRAPITAGESLAVAGFDLVSLANNHILDYGSLGLEDTLQTLASNQIHAVGAGMDNTEAYAPVFIEVDGLRLAFLAFADIPPTDYDYLAWEAGPNKPGVAWAHEQKVREGVQAAKNQADIVIVLVHNGYEFIETVASHQLEIARLAIDSGASLVIGSHPHVLQRIEPYRDGLIVYSMGNFVFDNFLFPPNYSAILAVELSPNGVESYQLIDVVVQLNGVPQIMPYKYGK